MTALGLRLPGQPGWLSCRRRRRGREEGRPEDGGVDGRHVRSVRARSGRVAAAAAAGVDRRPSISVSGVGAGASGVRSRPTAGQSGAIGNGGGESQRQRDQTELSGSLTSVGDTRGSSGLIFVETACILKEKKETAGWISISMVFFVFFI